MAGERLRHLARILRAEKLVTAATRRALDALLGHAVNALASSGFDTAVLDNRFPGWRAAIDTDVVPSILRVFTEAWDATARGDVNPDPYATRHLEAVHNRLVRVADDVFDAIRVTLSQGRQAGEGIPDLAKRVDALLGDEDRWTGRARTVARTEVISANNAGAHGAAYASADLLGVAPDAVVKKWLATVDSRTRPSHSHADGDMVPMDQPFTVGGSRLEYPGDPSGDAEEVINCRCSVLYLMPGDPDYPSDGIPDPGVMRAVSTPLAAVPLAAASEVSEPLAPVVPLTPAAQTVTEPVVDPGPQNDTERMSRALTYSELVRETKSGSAKAKAAAKAELRRRGLAAAGTPLQEDEAMTSTAPEDEAPSTVVLVALPAPDDPVRGVGDEDKHATILFFGETATLPDGAQDVINSVAASVASATTPFDEDVDSVTRLGSDDPAALVLMLSGDALPAVRQALLDADPLMEDFLTNAAQHPSFTPHVTLGYPEVGSADEADWTTAGEGLDSIRFDRLAVWWGGAQTEYALTGTDDAGDDAEGDDAAEGDALAAAAGEPAPPQAAAVGDPAPVVLMDPAEDDDQFYGVMVVEDSQTGDGRVFAPGAITWDSVPFPIPLGWQVQDAMGHDGSVVAGRIDTITRMGNLIAFTGAWDLGGAGYETRRLVEGRFLTGLSVDTDDFDAVLVDADGNPVDPMVDMFGGAPEAILRVSSARIRSAAMCRVPAFTEAFIANGVPPQGWAGERPGAVVETDTPAPVEAVAAAALVAAAARAGNPARAVPSLTDFSDPGLPGPIPITVDDDGRVYGHLAAWGVCHIGLDGCVEPPRSPSGYAYFMTGEIETDQGFVPVGQITMGTGHASTMLNARAAAFHYDNTGAAVADVSVGEDEHGIWVAGRLRGDVSAERVSELRAAGAISGDWRTIAGNLELVAALAVNVPGFPIPRFSVAASAGVPTTLVAAGIVPPTKTLRSALDDRTLAASTALEVVRILDRRERTRAALSRVTRSREQDRRRRVTVAAARITRRKG